MRLTMAALALTCWAGTASAQVAEVGREDPLMNAAIAAAQDTAPDFLTVHLPAEGPTADAVVVKVGVPTEEDDGPTLEHIWVAYVERAGDGLVGVLQNQPVWFEGELGGELVFTADQITDWMLSCPDARYGGWTVRAVFEGRGEPMPDGFSDAPIPAGLVCP